MSKYHHLSPEEWAFIMFERDRGSSLRQVAQKLERSLATLSRVYQWDLNYGEIALMWRGGCIIRAQFLGNIKEAYDNNPGLQNLLLDCYFKNAIETGQSAWRSVIATAVKHGVPITAG